MNSFCPSQKAWHCAVLGFGESTNACIFAFQAASCNVSFSFNHQDLCSADLQLWGTFLTITGPVLGWEVPTWRIKKSGYSQLGTLGEGCSSGIRVVRMHHEGKERRTWCCPWVEFMLKYAQKCFPAFLQILIEDKKRFLGGEVRAKDKTRLWKEQFAFTSIGETCLQEQRWLW